MNSKRVVLITGATSNLGRGLVARLASRGMIVYAGARDIEKVSSDDERVRPIGLDVTSDDACEAAIEQIIDEEGSIDILINNAACTLKGLTLEFDSDDYLLSLIHI